MTNTYYDGDTNLDLIRSKKVAIIGYGSQGHAHALNLKDSGVDVRVGLGPNSKTAQRVREDGFILDTPSNVAAWADIVMILAPDTVQPKLYQDEISPHLDAGDTLMFSHGFNIRYETISPPAHVDVSMIAPKSPGHRVRETYQSGEGTPALLAIHQDSSGQAKDLALSYGMALGCTRAGVLETTFEEETETDLFGEQAVLCGGVSELVKAGFDTLVEAGSLMKTYGRPCKNFWPKSKMELLRVDGSVKTKKDNLNSRKHDSGNSLILLKKLAENYGVV